MPIRQLLGSEGVKCPPISKEDRDALFVVLTPKIGAFGPDGLLTVQGQQTFLRIDQPALSRCEPRFTDELRLGGTRGPDFA